MAARLADILPKILTLLRPPIGVQAGRGEQHRLIPPSAARCARTETPLCRAGGRYTPWLTSSWHRAAVTVPHRSGPSNAHSWPGARGTADLSTKGFRISSPAITPPAR